MVERNPDLSTEEYEAIASFLGYGNPSAGVWFIGIEEGLGQIDDIEARTNLKARASFEKIMDLHKAHLLLQRGGQTIDIELNPPPTRTWRWMAKIMRANEGNADWNDLKLAEEFVRTRLGRTSRNMNRSTFLTELSPIPARGTNDKNWMLEFKHSVPDLDALLRKRKERLRELAEGASLVFCYGNGSNRAPRFADLLGIEWQSLTSEISISRDSRRLLLPFFGFRQHKQLLAAVEELLIRGLL
jgi:hypothetical protein